MLFRRQKDIQVVLATTDGFDDCPLRIRSLWDDVVEKVTEQCVFESSAGDRIDALTGGVSSNTVYVATRRA